MRLSPRFLPTLALVTGLAAAPLAMAGDAPSADMVLARVGDTEITLGHMIALHAGLPREYGQIPAELIFPGMLDQLVRHALLAQTREGGVSALTRLSLENEQRALTAEEAARALAATAVTEEAIRKTYEDEIANAPAETEYHAAHILVESEDAAKALIAELDGGKDFAELAKEKSTGPSGPEGGDLGWFSDGMMVEPFFEAVAALKPGETSPPVQTDFGWHVIRLIESREKTKPPLDEVRDAIAQQLEQQAVTDELARLEGEITVERTPLDGFDMEIVNNTDLLEKN